MSNSLVSFIKNMINPKGEVNTENNADIIPEDKKVAKKSNKKAYFMLGIGLVLLIITSGLFGGGNTHKEKFKAPDSKAERYNQQYINDLEKRISKILSDVDQAGKIEVLITLKEGTEKIIATEIKRTTNENGQRDSNEKSVREEFIKPQIINKNNHDESPIILKEIEPRIEGVLVLSSGADNQQVSEQLYKAVLALLNVPSHKIQVLSFKK